MGCLPVHCLIEDRFPKVIIEWRLGMVWSYGSHSFGGKQIHLSFLGTADLAPKILREIWFVSLFVAILRKSPETCVLRQNITQTKWSRKVIPVKSTLTTNGKHWRRCPHVNGIPNFDNKSTAHLLGCRVMELFVLFELVSIFMFVRARDLCLISVFVWRRLVFQN